MSASTVSISIEWKGRSFQADLAQGYGLSIPLDHTTGQPNAFSAPLYEAAPHKAGDWIGDTRRGAPVNFYDLRLNPHGNGTHTECVGHIATERYFIHESLSNGFWLAELITAYPTLQDNGDRVIDQMDWEDGIDAIILRTMPNHPDKLMRTYSGTNPPYLDARLAERMADQGIQHLLLDLPSVDREDDAGALAAHKAFWKYPEATRTEATITELIYVDNVISDGLYLLQIQIPALMLDAAPSRPYIYPLR